MMKNNNQGQIWYTDFMVAVLIFVISLVIYYEFSTNISGTEITILDELVADAKSISVSLLSEGAPVDWDNQTAVRIGITDGNMRINQTKLDQFYYMNYNDSHRLFGTRYNYYIFFENKSNERVTITLGDSIGIEPVDYRDLIQVTRLVIHQSEILKMEVQVWRK